VRSYRTIQAQRISDASFPARPNQFVFPFGPFLVGNLPLSPHRGHLDNLAATVERALNLAVPCRRSGGGLARSSGLRGADLLCIAGRKRWHCCTSSPIPFAPACGGSDPRTAASPTWPT